MPTDEASVPLTDDDRRGLLRHMLLMRAIEERGLTLYKQGRVPGSFYDGRGQEAVSVGATCARVVALPTALTASVFARNPDVVARVARALPSGNLYVNRGTTGALVGRQPFGGSRLSGTGPKAGGPDYLLGFVDAQVVTENVVRHGLVV